MRLSLLDNRRNFLLYLDEDKVIPKYIVTWKNWDGTDLYVDTKAAEGGIPAYVGPTPTKPATQTVHYEFAGWTPSVVAVTGNTTYIATFTEVPNMIQIQWLNYDSSVIKMEEVQAGTKPTYSGTNPAKPSTTQYRYNFTGWSPNPAVIYEDTVYTAQFQEVPNTVTATFIKDSSDGGGTIKTVTVNYGETPVFGSADPTSTKGIPPEITFEGWEPALGPITQNTTYTAAFKDNRPYTVKFLARVITEYRDAGNIDPNAKFTITWKNEDGTILEVDHNVAAYSTPSYDGAIPTKESTSEYDYVFNGWSPLISSAVDNIAYTAVFKAIPIGQDPNLLYSLPQTTTFNGTNTFVDTETQVMKSKGQYTIACDVLDQKGFSLSDQVALIHCMHESNPWPGLAVQFTKVSSSVKKLTFDINGSSGATILEIPSISSTNYTGRIKIVETVDTVNGMAKVWCVIDGQQYTGTKALSTFVSVNENVLIGAYQNSSGSKGRYWKGTVYNFEIYDRIFTDAEAATYLAEDHS